MSNIAKNKNAIPPGYLESQGEKGELLENAMTIWREMFVSLVRRSQSRDSRADSMVSYDPVYGDGLVIMELAKEEGITQVKIANAIGVTPQTVGARLKKMEKKGLIERRRDELDARSFLVYMTEKGRTAARALEKERKYSGSMFEIYTKEELEQLIPLVERLTERLKAEYEATQEVDAILKSK